MDTPPPTLMPDGPTAGAPPLPAAETVPPPSTPASQSGPRLLSEIASGGMGIVYQGRDETLKRDLAVKVLLPEHACNPDLQERFLEEAQIAGQLQHPGIVPIHEAGRLADDRPYFTMKLVKGRTLADLLRERKSPADGLPDFLRIFEQICQTVAYAHSRGVIHRDLKPANIMTGAFGEVLVMDWGLAKVLGDPVKLEDEPTRQEDSEPRTHIRTARHDSEDSNRTGAGAVLGTPAFMPPEQARGDHDLIDARADVFGLGAILCVILTGKPPFDARGAEAHRMAATGAMADSMARLDACGADAVLIDLAKSCLAAEVWERPVDAGKVAEAITAYRAGVADRLRRAEVSAAEARTRGRWTAIAAALVVLLVLSVAGGWVLVSRQQAARDQELLRRKVDAEAALREASDLRGKDPRAARARLERAMALLEESGDEELAEEARRQLSEADEELSESRLAEGLDEAIALFGASDPRTGRWDFHQAGKKADAAFRRWGLEAGKGTPTEATSRLGKLQPKTRELVLQSLALWGWSVGNTGIEPVRGESTHLVGHCPPDTPAYMAGVRTGDTLLRIGIGDGPQHDVSDWSEQEVNYWLNGTGAFSISLTLRGPEEGASERRCVIPPRPLAVWINDTTLLLAPDQWRRSCREADGDPVPARRRESVRRLAETMNPGQPVWAQVEMSIRLGGINEPVRALEMMRRAARRSPGEFMAHIALSDFLHRETAYEEEIRHLLAAVALRPNCEAAHLRLAYVWRLANNPDEAIAVLRDAVAARPGSQSLWIGLGLALEAKGDDGAALHAFREAAKLPDATAYCWECIGTILGKKEKSAEVEAAFRKALTIEPRSGTTLVKLALAIERVRPSESLDLLRRAVRDCPEEWRAWIALGQRMEEAGELAAAEKHFRHATRLAYGSSASLAWAPLAVFLRYQGRSREAVGPLIRATGANPLHDLAWYELGMALYNVGRILEAEQAMRHYAWLRPRDGQASASVGIMLYAQGRHASAAREFGKACLAAPRNAEFLHYLGLAFRDNGEPVQAESSFRQAFDAGGGAPAGHGIVEALQRQGKRHEAIALGRRLVALFPNDHDLWCRLGTLYRQMGWTSDMVHAFRRAFQCGPACPTLHDEIAQHLLERGETDAALATLRDGARRLGPSRGALRGTMRFATRLKELESRTERLAPEDAAKVAWQLRHDPRHRTRAAELYLQAIAEKPRLIYGVAIHAARAAVLAGGPRWRLQGLTWLSSDAGIGLRELPTAGEQRRAQLRRILQGWLVEPDFASVRDEPFLGDLPPEERGAWVRFWESIRSALRATASGA